MANLCTSRCALGTHGVLHGEALVGSSPHKGTGTQGVLPAYNKEIQFSQQETQHNSSHFVEKADKATNSAGKRVALHQYPADQVQPRLPQHKTSVIEGGRDSMGSRCRSRELDQTSFKDPFQLNDSGTL